ncbi:MAG TPA: peptidoglycan-binding domain-containing protein [Roseiarcus sp.]|nr:peptidoglycan-binding domain-containing protein [Roseiarcus sp.]
MAIFMRPGPRLAFLIGAAAFLIGGDAAFAAQNASPPAAGAADQVFQAQKAAYEALSEADRRAIQDALIWTGDYNGVVDGNFGKRTRDAILAYQADAKTPTTGILDPAALARLIAVAGKAKAAVKFQIVADDKSGVRIGAPLRLLDRRAALPNGSRLANAEGSATLDLVSAGGDLAALYARLSADTPGRKTTLKLSRPDFFVLSGEEGGRKFYLRYAKAPTNWPDPSQVRGFKLTYPAQSASFDRIAVAIADTFEPFPAAATPAANATTVPAKAPTPSKPALAANGLIVAAGEALTALDSGACPHPSVDGKPAKYLREDKQAGLSLIGAGFAGKPAAAPLAVAPLSDDLVALTYAADPAGAKPALQVAAIAPLAGATDAAKPRLLASLPQNAAGSPVFDRSGALVAIVAPAAAEAKPVAGVIPLAPHPVVAASDIERFLAGADIALAKATEAGASAAGRIAAEKGALVVPIVCD